MISGITFIDKFVAEPEALFTLLTHTVQWDERMVARKTASYGKAYNYSQMEYPFQPFLPELEALNEKLGQTREDEFDVSSIEVIADR